MVGATLPATELPDPWPGVKAHWRRMLSVPSTAAVDAPGTRRQWHLLDNADDVAATGMEPVGTLYCVHGNPTWSYLWRTLLAEATSPATLAAGGSWINVGLWWGVIPILASGLLIFAARNVDPSKVRKD